MRLCDVLLPSRELCWTLMYCFQKLAAAALRIKNSQRLQMGEVQWFEQQQVVLCSYKKTLGFLSWLWKPSAHGCTYSRMSKASKSQLFHTALYPRPPLPGEAVQVFICLPLGSLPRCHEASSSQTSWVTCRSRWHRFSFPFWCWCI